MKLAIKYPRKKYIEAESISDLQEQLKLLMVERFDIKNTETKPFTDIINDINTNDISEKEFEVLANNNTVIVPTEIRPCEV